MLPVLHLDDTELAGIGCRFKPTLFVDHPGQFANSQAMQDGKRIDADKGALALLTDRAVDEVVRVRPVEHDEWLVILGASLHDVVHRADVGIETGAYVLNIEYQDIQVGQLIGARFLVLSINGDDGHAGFHVAAVLDLLAGVGCSPEAMFGSEDLADVDANGEERVQ